MPIYGQFQTRTQLASGESTVWTAARDDKEGFVVKSLDLDETIEDRDVLRARVDRFLDRARTMQTLSESGRAPNWIEIVDLGTSPAGAYYATRKHENSLRKVIRGRVRLDAAQLHHVVTGVFKGLCQIRELAGRPHGALKPENVLLDRVGDVRSARVVLTDPAPAGALDARATELEDVRALGRIVYELVFFEEFRLPGGWPLEDTEQWKRLGDKADQWRALCNRVLDPNAEPGAVTLESIADDIRGLKPAGSAKPAGGLPPIVKFGTIAAALLIVVGLGAHFAGLTPGLFRSSSSNGSAADNTDGPSPEEAQWKRWCIASATWLRDFVREIERNDEPLAGDPFLEERLGELVARIKSDGLELNPLEATSIYLFDLDDAEDQLPDDVDPAALVSANRAIDAIQSALAAWPAREQAASAVEPVRRVGWTDAAGVLVQWVEATEIRSLDEEDDLVGGFRGLLETAGIPVALAGYAERADPLIDKLARAGVAEADGLRAFLHPTAGGEASRGADLLRELSTEARRRIATLADLGELIDEKHGDAIPEAALTRFRQKVAEEGLAATDPLYYQTLRLVLTTQPTTPTPTITDPDPDWRDRFARRLESIERRIEEAAARDGLRPTERSALSDLRSQIVSIRDEFESRSTELTPDNVDDVMVARGTFDDRAGEVVGSLDEIIATVDARTQSLAELARQIKTSDSVAPPASRFADTLDAAWIARREGLIETAGHSAANLRAERDALVLIIRMIDRVVEPGPAIPTGTQRLDREALDRAIERRREATVHALLAALPEQSPADGWASFEPASSEPAGRYANWIDGVENVLEGAAWIERHLERGYPLEEPVPGNASIASVASDIREDDVYSSIRPALDPLERLMAEVESARATGSWSEAFATVEQRTDSLPVAIAAWRSLADSETPSPTQRIVDALVEAELKLRAAIGLLESSERAAALRDQLDQSRSRHIVALLESASNLQQFKAVADQAEKWAGDAGADRVLSNASPRVRFNLLLRRLLADLDSIAAADPGAEALATRVKARAERFRADLDRLEGFEPSPAARDWVSRLESLDRATGVSRKALQSEGPGGAGWTLASVKGDRVTYTSPAGVEPPRTLEFVQVPDAGPPGRITYLCTTEVSLGLLASVAADAGAWDGLSSVWPELAEARSDPSSRWAGPRVWQWKQGRLAPSSRWFFSIIEDPVLAEAVFPPELSPSPPREGLPMQRISARAAAEFALLLGCRLPTPEEWRAAHAMEQEHAGRSGSPPTWNERGDADDLWWKHHQHLEQNWNQREPAGSYFLHAQAFNPGRVDGRPVPTDPEEARPNDSGRDGTLLFEPVGEPDGRGSMFRHLVGNVAEFVAVPNGQDGEQSFGVIGRSALSSPLLKPAEVYTPSGLLARLGPENWIFADVGFRLAFSAPAQAGDLAQKLSDVRRDASAAFAF